MNIEGDAAPSMSERPLVLGRHGGLLLGAAWISIILVSDVPNWILETFGGQIPDWITWGKASCMLVFLAACLLWNRLRPLLPFSIVILAFQAALAVTMQMGSSSWWKDLWTGDKPSFWLINIQPFIPDMVLTLAVLAALWLLLHSRKSFFLAKGDTQARIEPVRWLGIGKGESWKLFGWIFTAAATLAIAIPTFMAQRPNADTWLRVLPFLPAILLLAAINAFDGGVGWRADDRIPGLAPGKGHVRDRGPGVALDHALRSGCGDLHVLCAGVAGQVRRNNAPKNAPSPSRPVHAVLGSTIP